MQIAHADERGLELALLRRGVDQRAAGSERCSACTRTPLTGERVYLYEKGQVLCELCRSRQRQAPVASHIVHTPASGRTIRVIDQRAA